MTQNELNRFQAVLTARVAELKRDVRRRDDITVERNADQLDEIREHNEAIRKRRDSVVTLTRCLGSEDLELLPVKLFRVYRERRLADTFEEFVYAALPRAAALEYAAAAIRVNGIICGTFDTDKLWEALDRVLEKHLPKK